MTPTEALALVKYGMGPEELARRPQLRECLEGEIRRVKEAEEMADE